MTRRFSRPPINHQNFPSQPGPPQSIATLQDECAALPSLRAAYYALLAGQQSAQVRDGDRWQSFARGDAKELRALVQRIETQCDPRYRRGRAIRYGGYNAPRFGDVGYPWGYGGGW